MDRVLDLVAPATVTLDSTLDTLLPVSEAEPASVSLALVGSGGAGAMRAGEILLDAAAEAGFFGMMTRAMGPQIRGGEAAALLRIGTAPIASLDDHFDLLIALDWDNFNSFADELPLAPGSLVITDPAEGARCRGRSSRVVRASPTCP